VGREVFTVSADRLSPEQGSYGFAQQMLRQVAYDTLSRRDRKARHLKVAAHLRAAFPGDGEEVSGVIARHYLDALEALPADPDAGQIRGQAIAALIRAAERAGRAGAPAAAAASYVAAAKLTRADTAGGQQTAAAALWEHGPTIRLTTLHRPALGAQMRVICASVSTEVEVVSPQGVICWGRCLRWAE
jgi:predicted ATPase